MPQLLPIVDLLASVPAEGALFTTYTLSLTWFEAYLLRPLEQKGVSRVAILADPHGVDQSLRERLAAGPGLRYSVSAVPREGGSFHPKVILTWSDRTLLLAVGSGNLTLPGMQRNLEVFDVLAHGVADIPERHTLTVEVAAALHRWLGQLSELLEARDPSRKALTGARRAVQTFRPSLPSRDDIDWIDTFAGTIGEQLADRLPDPAEGEPREMAALSPFHDPAGEALRRLATDCSASSLTVLGTSATTFPLAKATRWPELAVEGKRLTDDTWRSGDSARPLHAKVVRVRDPDASWLLAGSANLTHTALWTQKNVEVSLLRRGEPNAWDELLATGPGRLEEEESQWTEPLPRPLVILAARASGAEAYVRLHCSAPSPMEVTVQLSDEESEPVTLRWGDGVLRWQLPEGWSKRRPAPVQVVVEAEVGGRRITARAWLAQEGWLDASPRWRRASVAWSHLLGNGSPDGQEAELLRIFAAEHVRTMRALGTPARSPRGGSPQQDGASSAEGTTPVSLNVLLAREGLDPSAVQLGTQGSTGTVEAVRRAMLNAFRNLEQPFEDENESDEDHGAETSAKSKRGAQGSGTGPRRLPKPVVEALSEFEQSFWDACGELVEAPPHAGLVLSYIGMVNQLALRLRTYSTDSREALWLCADRMVRATCCARPSVGAPPVLALLRSTEDPPPPEVLNLLAGQIAALHARSQRDEASQSKGSLLRGAGLREALSTLDNMVAGAERLKPELPLAMRQMAGLDVPLADALRDLRKVPSPSYRARWLKWAVRRVHHAGVAPRDLPPPSGARLDDQERRLVRAPRGKVHVVFPWAETCPRCHMVLSQSIRRELAARRPVVCTGLCRDWLLPSEGV